MKDLLTINIFSNSCAKMNSTDMIAMTYDSMESCFDIPKDVTLRVFIDPNPAVNKFDQYRDNVNEWLTGKGMENSSVIQTCGLVDSYIKSIELADTPFCLQFEHDWLTISEHIPHSLEEITETMEVGGIDYIKFNKRRNAASGWERGMKTVVINGMELCENAWRSNLPHIIKTHPYREHIKFLDPDSRGCSGLEKTLVKCVGMAHSYGKLGHPMTESHIDGRTDFPAYLKGELTYEELIEGYVWGTENSLDKEVQAKGVEKVFGDAEFIWDTPVKDHSKWNNISFRPTEK